MNGLSRLEIFPDELFLELFSYIPPNELYTTWHNLNHRINAILQSVRISFDLIEYTNNNHEILNYFSKQVVYLCLRVSNDLLDLKKFSNLRSLVIETKLNIIQFQSIQSEYLPYLKRIRFSEWWQSKDPFINMIFDEKLSWLKVYHLPSIPNCFLKDSSKFSYIQTMIFDRITSCDIHLILSFQTILRCLKVTIVS